MRSIPKARDEGKENGKQKPNKTGCLGAQDLSLLQQGWTEEAAWWYPVGSHRAGGPCRCLLGILQALLTFYNPGSDVRFTERRALCSLGGTHLI